MFTKNSSPALRSKHDIDQKRLIRKRFWKENLLSSHTHTIDYTRVMLHWNDLLSPRLKAIFQFIYIFRLQIGAINKSIEYKRNKLQIVTIFHG